MAQPTAFINTSRARVTAVLKALEDLQSLETEFNSVGGVTFTNGFDFNGENASSYDLTQAEFNAGLTAIGRILSAFRGQAVTASASAQGDLYKLKA